MDMKDRIRQLMEAQHMTQQMFAQFLGMAPATLSSILNDRTKPTLNTVEAIRNKFPSINIDWLMFGNGTMFVDDAKENDVSSTPRDGMAGEQTLNFGDAESVAENVSYNAALQRSGNGVAARSQQVAIQPVRTDVVYKEKECRRITEIRVFYDDQTWESFVPKK